LQATCNKCTKIFKIHLKEKDHPRGIKEHYFLCKYCKKRYTSFITDKKVRSLQKEMKRTTDVEKRTEIQKEVSSRMEVLKSEVVS